MICGRAEGLAEGVARGRAFGKQEGLAEGIARGRVESLIAMLDARGVALRRADRAKILRERDPAILARWIARAATCTNVAEVFGEA